MENILIKIKNNLLFILLPIAFISFLLININVVYFGDDFYYLTFRDLNFQEYFSTLANHYLTSNGRFIVHMLATIFLKFPLPIWQIINSLMLTGICYFTTKIISSRNSKALIFSVVFMLIATLNIMITRQSVYWLTGSFNYVFPILLLLAYWHCLKNIDSKKHFLFSIILGFLSAATVEQAGMMTFGLTILMLLSKVSIDGEKTFKKEKLTNKIKNLFKALIKTIKENKKLIILILVTLIGVCTVLLSPSQFRRIGEETKDPLLTTVLHNFKFIIYSFTADKLIIPFYLLFNISVFLYTYKNSAKNKYLIYFSVLLNVIFNTLLTLVINVNTEHPFTIINILSIFIILLTYLVNFIYINKQIYNKLFSSLTISAILMLGSQLMMIISPVYGPRNLIFALIMFAILICIILNKANLKYTSTITLILTVIALFANFNNTNGYAKTKFIEDKNIEIIQNSQDIISDENSEIILYKYIDDNYGWSMPYQSTYHLYYYKLLHNIKCNILWDDYTL